MTNVPVRSLFIAVALVAAPGLSIAQPGMTPSGPPGQASPASTPASPVHPGPAAHKSHQRGFILGGSAGFGLREDGGFAGSLSIGTHVRPNIALIGDISILGDGCEWDDYDCTDEIGSLVVLGGGIRWWLSERWWAQGTIGLAGADRRDDSGSDDGGLGWTASGGVDFFTGPSAAIDARIMFLGGMFEDIGPVRGTLGIGITIR